MLYLIVFLSVIVLVYLLLTFFQRWLVEFLYMSSEDEDYIQWDVESVDLFSPGSPVSKFYEQVDKEVCEFLEGFQLAVVSIQLYEKMQLNFLNKCGLSDDFGKKLKEHSAAFIVNNFFVCHKVFSIQEGVLTFFALYISEDDFRFKINELVDWCCSYRNGGERLIEPSYVRAGVALNLINSNTDNNVQASLSLLYVSKLKRLRVVYSDDGISDIVSVETAYSLKMFSSDFFENLKVYYQPIILSSSCKVVAYESLLRWQVDGKFVSPEVFIPIAENNGMIEKISKWVLNSVVDSFYLKFFDVPVSVNLSVSLLFSESFICFLCELDFPPGFIKIEITESEAILNTSHLSSVLSLLERYGFIISLDDFTKGNSKLEHIFLSSVSEVKIDKSFVENIILSNESYLIVDCLTKIAHSFGVNVVAEGVETEEQFNLLKNVGVDCCQGFLFSMPMPIDQI